MINYLDSPTAFPLGVDHHVLKSHVIETQPYDIANK